MNRRTHSPQSHPDASAVLSGRLVCTTCGAVATVEFDDLAAELRASAERHGVEIDGHALTVFGRCAVCCRAPGVLA